MNSTAILALAMRKEIPWPDYIVFSDTGAEWPHTYKYLSYLENKGINFTFLTGGIRNMTIIEFCRQRKIIPSRVNRWCTDYFKRIPIQYFIKSFEEEIESWIGFDAGELQRTQGRRKRKHRYPLIELGLNREKCKEVIRKAGLGVPQKSGCFICPFQNKAQWIQLKKYHPDLWKIAVELEKLSIKTNPLFSFIKGKTIEKFVSDLDRQEELPFDFSLDQKCECFFD